MRIFTQYPNRSRRADSAASGTSRARKAFTLIELLVVISIISMLIALLLPALSRARGRAIDLKCIGNMHGANLAFQSYFNDFKTFMPPLSGTRGYGWGYNYGTWYENIAIYAGVSDSGYGHEANRWQYDKPYALSDPGSVSGDSRFPQYLYSTLWGMRFREWNNSDTSQRTDDFAKPSDTGLLVDSGGSKDSIYYMSITAALLSTRPMHDGRGVGVTYMDGHANFINVHMQEVVNFAATSTRADDYGPDVPWVHKTFWGRLRDGTYTPFSSNYPTYK